MLQALLREGAKAVTTMGARILHSMAAADLYLSAITIQALEIGVALVGRRVASADFSKAVAMATRPCLTAS